MIEKVKFVQRFLTHLPMMVVKPPVVVFQEFASYFSNTCNDTCRNAGIINQPTNRELLSKTEKIMDLVEMYRIDVSCHHDAKYLNGLIFAQSR